MMKQSLTAARNRAHKGEMEGVSTAAETIARARHGRKPLAPLAEAQRPADEAAAYAVQDALHAALAPAFGAIVGRKIGCTTPVMQRYLRIDHPCAGGVFAATVHASGAVLPYRDFVHVGVECEIAVRLKRDIAGAADIPAAIGGYMAAIELVDDRYVDWRKIDTPTLIADDFFGAGCILGPEIAASEAGDISQAIGRTIVNGVEVGRGRATDVMGHPHNALAWLAEHAAARGRALRAGEFVLTGSFVEVRWLAPGDSTTVSVSGLGSVAVTLTP